MHIEIGIDFYDQKIKWSCEKLFQTNPNQYLISKKNLGSMSLPTKMSKEGVEISKDTFV